VQGTDIKEELDNRLQEIIDSHLSSLGAEFRRLIGDLPLQVDTAEEASGESQAEALAHLKQSVEAIHATSSQREMAYRLLDAASQQAARSALFLMRGATCVGFETRGFADPPAEFDQTILTPMGDDPLCAALNQQETMHLHGSSLAASALADWIGEAQPQQVCLAPVVVGGQTVAVVYADSGVDAEAGTIYPDSVEILASVAGMFLERMRRPAPALTDRNQAAGETTDHPVENPTSGEGYQAVPLSDESDAAETTLDTAPDHEVQETDEGALAAAPATGDEPLVADPGLALAQDAPDSVPQDTEDDLPLPAFWSATRHLPHPSTPRPPWPCRTSTRTRPSLWRSIWKPARWRPHRRSWTPGRKASRKEMRGASPACWSRRSSSTTRPR
jgi:hypothetical protein